MVRAQPSKRREFWVIRSHKVSPPSVVRVVGVGIPQTRCIPHKTKLGVSESSRFQVLGPGTLQAFCSDLKTWYRMSFAAVTQARSSSRRHCQGLLQQPFARDFTAQDKAGASCDKGLRNLDENLKAIPELSSCYETHPEDKCAPEREKNALPPVFPSAVVQEEPTGESILAFEDARRVPV